MDNWGRLFRTENIGELLVVTAIKWLIAVLLTGWTAIDTDLKILCILSVVDIVTCLFNSTKSLLLLCRRLAVTFILVLTVHYVYGLAQQKTGVSVGFDLGAMVCLFYSLGEVIAILRNVNSIVKIPPVLLDLVSRAEGLTGADREEVLALKVKQQGTGTATAEVQIKPKEQS